MQFSLGVDAPGLDCLMQTWDLNSLSLFAAKLRIFSEMVLPRGGPEGTNTQAQSEQPQPGIYSTHIIARAKPDYSVLALEGISHYTRSPLLVLNCLSVFIWAECVIRGCAISLVTLVMIDLSDADLVFLLLLL
jgi:hypothetical protein